MRIENSTRLFTIGQTLYLSYSNFNQVICTSTDFGDTWTPLNATFPPSFNSSITVLTASGTDLYVGTNTAVYKLTKGDSMWNDITGNIPGGYSIEAIVFKGNTVGMTLTDSVGHYSFSNTNQTLNIKGCCTGDVNASLFE